MKTLSAGHCKLPSRRARMAKRLALSCGVSMASGLVTHPAHAQAEAPSAAASASAPGAPSGAASAPVAAGNAQDLGNVIVSARRRNEALVDVPLAISVVTAKKIEQLDIRSTTDLANYTPGLEFNSFTPGNSRNDRGSGRALTFRGLLLSGTGGGGASVFLNGAAVLGNEVPASLDIGQVEVLRGPQSVYFGRSTMTGAVSYRTKPIPDHWTGEVDLEVGQRDTHNEAASVAGPLVPGLLAGRLTVLGENTGGYVRNNYDGSELGKQSRRSISTTLELTPTDAISVKGYFNYFTDDDGPSATAFVPASLDNCKLGTTQTTFCGEIPGRSNSINYVNTTIPANMSSLIFTSPLLAGSGFDKKIGQQRQAYNSDVAATWNLSDYLKLQSITGYHTNITMAALDGIAQPVQPTFPYSAYFYTYTQKFSDFSQELRLSSDPDQRFSWTVGANYVKTSQKTQAIVGFQTQPANVFRPLPQSLGNQLGGTVGVFGGAYFKATPELTLSAEAREQRDNRRATALSGTTGASLSDLSDTFKSFSPRLSADYDVGGRRKVYVSYATGTRPGGFNTGIAAQANNPTALAQIQELIGNGAAISYKEEKLKVAELGFKGDFDGGKGFFDLNTYIGTLTNQQINIGALIPVLGYSVTGTTNAGESKIHGIEFQGDYNFPREFSLGTTFAWNYSKRTKFLNTAGLAEFGTTDFSGKKFANVPEYSWSVVGTYTRPLVEKWNFYTTVAGVYRGKQYVDAFNASWIKGRFQTDLHVGAANDKYTVEGYVKNVFNDQNYTGGNTVPDYGTNSYNAFFGGWAPPREIGLRLRAAF